MDSVFMELLMHLMTETTTVQSRPIYVTKTK